MKHYFSLFLFVLIFSNSYGQSSFSITKDANFDAGQSNKVAYLNFPDIHIFGYFEITITGAFNGQLNTGKLTKRIVIGRTAGVGYFSQSNEIVDAIGDVVTQWHIGDFDNTNRRIPIHHLVSTGNRLIIKIEGLLYPAYAGDTIKKYLNVTIGTETLTKSRQYKYMNSDKIGIGTSSPGNILTVRKDQQAYTYIASDNAYTAGAGVGSGFAITQNNNMLWFLRGERDNSKKFSIGNTKGIKLTIDSLGNIGIGTVTPGQYKLAVVGKIHANEVVIETGWSDFVFEKNYKLLTIEEVQAYINKHHHLPGIPSAEDVKQNGVNLGDMQSKLLQKIEELTLYIIEMNKRISTLENENKHYKMKIENDKNLKSK